MIDKNKLLYAEITFSLMRGSTNRVRNGLRFRVRCARPKRYSHVTLYRRETLITGENISKKPERGKKDLAVPLPRATHFALIAILG